MPEDLDIFILTNMLNEKVVCGGLEALVRVRYVYVTRIGCECLYCSFTQV